MILYFSKNTNLQFLITSIMKFENIPKTKPSAPNVIWKDGEFLKIS